MIVSEPQFKRISVIGLGYIGLPTAAMFASRKVEVVGVDVNQHVVRSIGRHCTCGANLDSVSEAVGCGCCEPPQFLSPLRPS